MLKPVFYQNYKPTQKAIIPVQGFGFRGYPVPLIVDTPARYVSQTFHSYRNERGCRKVERLRSANILVKNYSKATKRILKIGLGVDERQRSK